MRDVTAVLGGSGFLGAHVVRQALAAGHAQVLSASRAPEAAPSEGDPRLRRTFVDALDTRSVAALLEREQPARVIVCTALPSLDDCARYPALARAINAELPGHVGAWTAPRGARLVHVSTDLVFGRTAAPRAGFGESDEPGPVSEYGESKLAGERAVLAVDPAALVVRLPLLYGESFGRARGASDSMLAAIARGETPQLFTDELRTPLDVEDAAAALTELALRRESGLLHVAGPERVSRYDLGLAVLRARGVPEGEARSKIRAATRAERGMDRSRPADVSLDASRARALLAARLRGAREALATPD